MRIVHISDTAFLGVPEGACLHVALCDDYNLEVCLSGISWRKVIFSFVNPQRDSAAQMKAHVEYEMARFGHWLLDASEGSEFEFQRVLDLGAPVADEPFRIREGGGA